MNIKYATWTSYELTKNRFLSRTLPLLCVLLLAGCVSSPVEQVRPNYWAQLLTETALTTDQLSEHTSAYLALRGWQGRALRKPEPILKELRAELIRDPDRGGLTVFAEFAYLSGHEAKKLDEKVTLLLTAARAAYATLFDEQMGPMLDPLDPNLRFAADLYNYSLSELVDLLLEAGRPPRKEQSFGLIDGRLTLIKGQGMEEAPGFTQTLLAFSHKTTALELHNRRRGIGVPVVTVRPPTKLLAGQNLLHPPVYQAGVMPVTFLLRFSEPWRATGESLTATCELWKPLAMTRVEIGGRYVPLEADTSLALAEFYAKGEQFYGILNMLRLLRGNSVEGNRGLFLLEPYNPKKIPVVLTHGLMDSPLTWVPMLNALLSDPALTEKYQFWLFFYPTMNPILQSASELRQSLLAFHANLKAKGEAWNDMVLVGHSMGGLISRLMISPSGEPFRNLSQHCVSMAEGDLELQTYIKSLVTFEPLPFVSEAIFLGAPHRGANMANRMSGSAGQGIMSRPEYIRTFLEAKEGRAEQLLRQANGIANLAPDSLFSLALGDCVWNPAVPVHSIIGDMWTAGSTNGTDGVVAYWSSHVNGAKSEIVVQADHLALHKKNSSITEVRRILLEHLMTKPKVQK
jgi:pimeloyl-ACP methyl ester carboxylesterase